MSSLNSAISINQAGSNPVFNALGASSAAANTSSASTTGTAQSSEVTEDRFLKLLVAQLQNQDPLNPLDNAQVTTQMAQISTVQGIEKLNAALAKFVSQSSGNRAVDAVGMIGRDVMVEGTSVEWAAQAQGTTAVRLGLELPSDASSARLEIVDAGGVVLRSLNLPSPNAGSHSLVWDGKTDLGVAAADGRYSLRAVANSGTTALDARALVAQRVVGVSEATGSDGQAATQLQTADGRNRMADSIRGIFRPLQE
jgi:flagellar basal-body rod modification protein FlgD